MWRKIRHQFRIQLDFLLTLAVYIYIYNLEFNWIYEILFFTQ